jgi:uncharacterized membrane protein
MSASTAPSPMQPRRKWLRVALVASLAVNLLVIGAAAGSMYRINQQPPTLSSVSTNLLAFTSSLPEPRRKELWAAIREEHRRLRPLRDDVRAARLEWRQVLSAEPFDRERFDAAQKRVLDAENKARSEAQRLFASLATHLTVAERAAFLDWQPADRPWRERRSWWGRGTVGREVGRRQAD